MNINKARKLTSSSALVHISRKLARGALAASMLGIFATAALPAHAASYTWNSVKIIDGGFVSGIVAHPGQQGLFYARTDVGGAYRYNSASSTWIPLSDWTAPGNWYHMGIETIAIDPNNTSKLYMVAGEYTNNWDGNAVFLASSDQGATFTSTPLSFHAGGNNNGRNAGERLQVDPNLGSVLFYGTFNDSSQGATNGLYKSTNSGQTWTKLTGFTALTSDGTGAGVAFVTLYKPSASLGTATPTLFAGVSTSSAKSAGVTLYKSTNGGTTWSAVTGGPVGYYPNHGQIGQDGNLYITYGNGIGPDDMSAGQVWKYSVSANTWQNISPPNGNFGGFGGLSVDTRTTNTLVVTTMDRYALGDTMFRSTNGGASWTDVGAAATRDDSLSPYIHFGNPSPPFGNYAQVTLDPFNSAHAFYTTGATVWTSGNLTAADSGQATNWTIGANGIELSAPHLLVSPTSGPPLISGLGDICGFVHTSLTTSPTPMANPLCQQGTGLDYAKSSPTKIVRVGTNLPGGAAVFGAVSTNSGTSWTAFSSQGGSSQGGGTVAISADGANIVWAPWDVAPVLSTNNGASWTSTGLPLSSNMQMVSDSFNSNLMYAYDAKAGTVYASSNKGVNWYTASSGLPTGGNLTTPFGIQGDLWLSTSSGLYRSTSSGSSWTKLTTVTSAIATGFGKAATGASYPTIYMSGTINGVQGLYRSTDTGNTWTQINDSAHQYGGIGYVTGDPKTFGTVYIAATQGLGRGIIVGTSSN